MSTKTFAFRQERTRFIVCHLPSYIRALKDNESDEFLKILMTEFIARFPMDIAGMPQSEPLRLTRIDSPELRNPHEMFEVAMKGHLSVSLISFLLIGTTPNLCSGFARKVSQKRKHNHHLYPCWI